MELIKNFIVKDEYTAKRIGSGSLEVLSTPFLSAFMENVGFEIVEKIVDDGYTSVGTYIELKHLKASKVNSNIKVVGKLISRDNKRVRLDIKAYENDKLIGECIHERVIINISDFLKKLL
ncbi:MAG TPA: thioesterase family protein [Spirochaetota bacterium]|nr:thioesterase family protein [Spirochaetota bacterium]HOM38576.1 thioesterase family protein [Spirochaetota bacterium]HPQ49713.1 thioesterase family protein [Spirochaetota bacterium]